MGALAGGAVDGVLMLGIIAICQAAGWWRFVMRWDPYYLLLMWIGGLVGAFVFLLTWRLARRFGGRGLAIALFVIAGVGPLRDSWYMITFPEWGTYAPGIAPMLAISVAYIIAGVAGHGTMRLVAGPAEADQLSSFSALLGR